MNFFKKQIKGKFTLPHDISGVFQFEPKSLKNLQFKPSVTNFRQIGRKSMKLHNYRQGFFFKKNYVQLDKN